ncbi:MAG: hypothetical protein WDO24_07385 [Pseudomonadota bacterium]
MAQSLADFFSALAMPDRPPATPHGMSTTDRRGLAIQLLKTLSVQVLAEAGYRNKRLAPDPVPRRRELLPSPRPVGDLARPRLNG